MDAQNIISALYAERARIDRAMRVEMNESMLNAMNRMNGASHGKASSGKHLQESIQLNGITRSKERNKDLASCGCNSAAVQEFPHWVRAIQKAVFQIQPAMIHGLTVDSL